MIDDLRAEVEELRGGSRMKNPLVKRKNTYDIILFGE